MSRLNRTGPNFRQIILQEIKKIKPKKVLQLGCVQGLFSLPIAQALFGYGELTVVDVSPNALEITKNKVAGWDNVISKQINAEDTGFPKESFDTVILYFLLHEVSKEAKTNIIHEACRVLKKDGTLFLADYHKAKKSVITSVLEKFINMIEPYSGELMRMDLVKALFKNGVRVKKQLFGNLGLTQLIIAKK
ncbi:class I SAM-dependent methyltransferase [Candidatus Microgenomates bacterium]|nr:class I SAM-dependent methyltransferase [Candidatus Microgenomates bacterium]